MRKNIVAGNWKMNLSLQEGLSLAEQIALQMKAGSTKTDKVILCTPATHLHAVSEVIKGVGGLSTGAQNCHQEAAGAYTGEISTLMIQSCGAEYVILGHSERRAYNQETNDLLRKKIDQALKQGLNVIYCCGEMLAEREKGTHFDLVKQQITEGLFHLSAMAMSSMIIAYEPVWAIGTGVTASKEQAQEMHAFIRSLLTEQYGSTIANDCSILYGGSCNPKNAKELFEQADVDGGLIGGASLKAEDFMAIIQSF
jgi:triosephosphate isomerase (TIM)